MSGTLPGTRATPPAAPDVAGWDVAAVRADFPALHQEVHGRPLAYLDNAATTQKPRCVIDAVSHHYERDCSNVHRGVHLLSERATAAFEGAREGVAQFLGARSAHEIVFVRGTTEAINLVARSFVRPRLTAGDEVLITGLEHHSNIVPWQMVTAEAGAKLVVAPMNDDGTIPEEGFARLLSERTKFAAFAHVSNALGTVNPVARFIALARERGVPVLIDGAQAVPHLPVDVKALGADFYAFSAHKVYGPTGFGALWARAEHLESMPPWQGGGDMIASVSFEKTTWNKPPWKFEAGTPHVAGAIGLHAAIDYVTRLGLPAIAAHEAALLARATQAVAALPGVRLIGTAPRKASVLSFVMEGIHPHDIGSIVDRHGVAIRTGHHCAEPVMQRLGIPATARASFGLYNTPDEVDALVGALRDVLEVFG